MNKRKFKKEMKKQNLIFNNSIRVKPSRRKWFIKRYKKITDKILIDLARSLELHFLAGD